MFEPNAFLSFFTIYFCLLQKPEQDVQTTPEIREHVLQ